MKTRIYVYSGCDTCRRALKFLNAEGITHEAVPIRETPPTVAELRAMLKHTGELRRLFNTSGMDYRALGLKDRLASLPEEEALELLHSNGNLVKRPFLLTESSGLTGFDEAAWREALLR